MARTLTVSESADGLGGLVLEACEQLVELRDAERLEEPFAARSRLVKVRQKGKVRKELAS
jgi:hypothetical protein